MTEVSRRLEHLPLQVIESGTTSGWIAREIGVQKALWEKSGAGEDNQLSMVTFSTVFRHRRRSQLLLPPMSPTYQYPACLRPSAGDALACTHGWRNKLLMPNS